MVTTAIAGVSVGDAAVDADETAFLASVLEDPDEDTVRLAYADYLDEHDRPQQALQIRDGIAAGVTFRRPYTHGSGWLEVVRGFVEVVGLPLVELHVCGELLKATPLRRVVVVDRDGLDFTIRRRSEPLSWEVRATYTVRPETRLAGTVYLGPQLPPSSPALPQYEGVPGGQWQVSYAVSDRDNLVRQWEWVARLLLRKFRENPDCPLYRPTVPLATAYPRNSEVIVRVSEGPLRPGDWVVAFADGVRRALPTETPAAVVTSPVDEYGLLRVRVL
jgi:uncharacterized protein (TIGR02996 family)